MGIIRFYILSFCLLSTLTGFAQKTKEFQHMYTEAKRTFDAGQYKQSFDLFKSLAQNPNKNNCFYNYAHYFCGLSAYRLHSTADANFILTKIIQEDPEWVKTPEVRYLLAANALRVPDLEKVYLNLKLITEKDWAEDKAQLLKTAFLQTDSLELLIKLQQNHPDDLALANLLALKISTSPLKPLYQGQLEYLSQDYALDSTLQLPKDPKESIKKEEYTVAVLLPFETNNKKQPNPNSRFLEYYKGLQLATETLASQNVIVNLVSFDTKNDTNLVKEILANKKLEGVDLIIGPTDNESAAFVKAFAEENRVLHFHPFNGIETLDSINKNYYSFSYEPSNRTIAEEVSKHAFQNIENDSILILYGERYDDSIQATRYLELAKEKELVILGCQKITKDNVYLLEKLIQPDSVQSIGHIFVAGSKQLLATNVVSALSKSNVETPIYCSSNWLYYPQIEYQQFLHRQIHFVYPNYVKHHTPESRAFMRKYNADMKQEINQTLYGALGYDLMMYLGNAMSQYGNYFIPQLAEIPYRESTNTLGVKFNDKGQNRLVPILKFNEEFNFVWVNNPSK